MLEWIGANAEVIGGGVVALAGLAYAAWQKLQSMKVEKAKVGADVAIAESQREVYEQMKERMTDMQADLSKLRDEVDKLRDQIRERDNKIHALEMHIMDLEHTLRKHNIEPPARRL